MKMICRMLPSTNGSTMLVGTMWMRKSHQCWDSPCLDELVDRVRWLDGADVGVDALSEWEQVDRDQPEGQRKDGADLEVDQALMPMEPTCLMSATVAMPATMVRNTIGPISIRIAVTNVVPMGSIAVREVGREPADENAEDDRDDHPEVQLTVPLGFLTGPVALSAARESAIVPTSLSEMATMDGDGRGAGHCLCETQGPGRCVGSCSAPGPTVGAGPGAGGSGGDQGGLRRASTIASVTSSVSAVPPTSRVITPAAVTASIDGLDRAGLGVQTEVVQHQGAGGDRCRSGC